MITSFMGLEFETNEEVLIPREETEILARAALGLLDRPDSSPAPRVIDVCCGAGNLACTIAHGKPAARVWAADLTDACVRLARVNVARLGLEGRVEVRQGDLFASLIELGPTADLVVCNPPYISTGKLAGDSAHLLQGQPREAFDGGPYGFAIHRRVILDTPGVLRPGGWLVMEIGKGQEKQIVGLLSRSMRYEESIDFRDETGAPRVIAARLRTPAT
jgi:release factor glutamine methyltransferase